MRKLDHRNVVKLKYFFYSSGDKKDEVYLNLILEFVPDTVYRGFCFSQVMLFLEFSGTALCKAASNHTKSVHKGILKCK